MAKVLITGASGFIGSHLVEWFLKNTEHEITCLIRNNFAGTLLRLTHLFSTETKDRLKIVHCDLRDSITNNFYTREAIGLQNIVLHLAASSHVDRSIDNPMAFVQDNIVGTVNLLDYYRVYCKNATFIYFSTDEVFGPAKKEPDFTGIYDRFNQENHYTYQEWCRYNSANPYAATKAGAEEMCLAYANTYGLDIRISHCMNVIGERQHPEKLLPWCIKNALVNEQMPLHSNYEEGKTPTRFFIHAQTVADATNFILEKGQKREKYNIVGRKELSSLDIYLFVCQILEVKPNYTLTKDNLRPGHDPRYALDGTKLKNMGWEAKSDFWKDLEETIKWYVKNPQWL